MKSKILTKYNYIFNSKQYLLQKLTKKTIDKYQNRLYFTNQLINYLVKQSNVHASRSTQFHLSCVSRSPHRAILSGLTTGEKIVSDLTEPWNEPAGHHKTPESTGKGKTRQVSTTLFDTPETRKKMVKMGMVEGRNSSRKRMDEDLSSIQ
ncbi:hypothetical protein DYD21_20250 [Rhodohalobacter sp. SW132]|uniref:hypothetical protein n=1 Tax=Rhodohalobacter sp. SW132 TaxID=2293433 RepID=UPI000E274700|nr:hypothetical protein [Rhodohalobacter sp. SW132]REL24019.1 hypothetical protein DYD21_20250 [Rhodohalobacter sp. SW132]